MRHSAGRFNLNSAAKEQQFTLGGLTIAKPTHLA